MRKIDLFNGKALLNGRYRIGNNIGEGGLSTVYEVFDVYSQYFNDTRDLVIKIPLKKIATKKDIVAFVYSEYSLLMKLHHQNIVQAVDFGIDEESGLAYLVMQKLEGDLLINIPLHTLTKEMKNKIAFSLYQAVSYIHSKDIIHADINPTNIMVSKNGFAQLFDFGISQVLNSAQDFQLDFKKFNAYNPRYTAPEVINGEMPSKKSDLFSLACVLYELYTEKLPFKNFAVELKTKTPSMRSFFKIPFSQRYWIKKTINFELKQRSDKVGYFINLGIYMKKCSKMTQNK